MYYDTTLGRELTKSYYRPTHTLHYLYTRTQFTGGAQPPVARARAPVCPSLATPLICTQGPISLVGHSFQLLGYVPQCATPLICTQGPSSLVGHSLQLLGYVPQCAPAWLCHWFVHKDPVHYALHLMAKAHLCNLWFQYLRDKDILPGAYI